VVAPGDLERVELERPETLDDRHHAQRTRRQRARRGQEMASDEEPPRGRRADGSWGRGHESMVTSRTCHRVSPIRARPTWHPVSVEGAARALQDQEAVMLAVAAGVVAFIVVAGWSLLRWQMRGRDPSYHDDASILMPAPPDGMTAATATVIDGGPAGTAFMAGLLDLASRDEIQFRPDAPGDRSGIGIEIHGGADRQRPDQAQPSPPGRRRRGVAAVDAQGVRDRRAGGPE